VNKSTRPGTIHAPSAPSDGVLALNPGRLHEFYAAGTGDGAATLGLAALLAWRMAGDAPILWLRAGRRSRAVPYAPGLAALGLDPARLILVESGDVSGLLRAAGDAARCAGLGVLLIEARGKLPEFDLTVSRRLLLAIEHSRVTILLARMEAPPVPSAAETRWEVAAISSTPIETDAPGPPAFALRLLRHRGGPAGKELRVEWNRDQRCFRETALPGAILPFPAGGPAADRAPAFA